MNRKKIPFQKKDFLFKNIIYIDVVNIVNIDLQLNKHFNYFSRLLSLTCFVSATTILLLLRKFKSIICNPMGKSENLFMKYN